MLAGLEQVQQELEKLNIPFHLVRGYPQDTIPQLISEKGIDCVVSDMSPLRVPKQWVKDVSERLDPTVPFFQVDGHK